MVVIAEAERDGVKGGGPFRGAVFDHSLQVAPFCTLHGMMGILPYKRGPVGGFRAWHLQLGVGGMKGHTNARDCRRTRLVQQTRNYKPLVTLVNKMARPMLPDWFTRTTMQLSCNVLTKPHQHVHDASPWSAVFSTGQHTRGHLWVEVGGVSIGTAGGDVVCSAWMVLHVMAPRTIYASNRFSYVRVHGIALVLGRGRGGWWCCTPVVTGGHSRRGTVHSSMRPHSAYMQVHSGPLGGAPRRPWRMASQPLSNVLWIVCTTSSMCHNTLPQWSPDTLLVQASCVLSSMSTRRHQHALHRGTQPTPVVPIWILMEDAMCETVCRCSGRCKCKALAPKFQWMRQAEMAEC